MDTINDTSSFQLHILKQVGVTDEVDTCFCCGKTDLVRTVVFETTQKWQASGGDQFVFFGSTCAKKRNPLISGNSNDLVRKNGQSLREALSLHITDDETDTFSIQHERINVWFYVNKLTGEASVDGTAPLESVITVANKIISITEARAIYKEVSDLVNRMKQGCVEMKKEWIAGKWRMVAQ